MVPESQSCVAQGGLHRGRKAEWCTGGAELSGAQGAQSWVVHRGRRAGWCTGGPPQYYTMIFISISSPGTHGTNESSFQLEMSQVGFSIHVLEVRRSENLSVIILTNICRNPQISQVELNQPSNTGPVIGRSGKTNILELVI